jgi:UPF0755 protein
VPEAEVDVLDGDDEWVEVGTEPSGRRKLGLVLLGLVVGAIVLGGAAFVWFQRQVDPPGSAGEVVTVEIPEGTSTQAIGDVLEREGIIASSFVWKNWYVRFRDIGPFEAGQYQLATNSAMDDVVDALGAGPAPPPFSTVTVPEGLTVPEILARLADDERGLPEVTVDELEAAVATGEVRSKYAPAGQSSLEGLLFPETYRVEARSSELSVLQQMTAQLDQVLDELNVASAQARFNLTPYEILVVASLIEEETRVDAERPKVARVIYNRLRNGIPLGIDATSRYEAELAGRDREDVDFESDSPYNTRRIAGLPPTPIASPGRASIEAALNPVDGPWIYYVLADDEGNHFFTDSAQEFERAKAECREEGLGCG